jgi:NADP-dependent 3-hydroxy acid dehydrogenase YdfG
MYAASKHGGRADGVARLALQGKNIRVTAVMPGRWRRAWCGHAQEQLFGIARMFGVDPEQAGFKPGEQLPQEILDRVMAVAKNVVLRPEDIAEAVLYAVTQPETVHINEIMVRPSQQLQIPGMSLPA